MKTKPKPTKKKIDTSEYIICKIGDGLGKTIMSTVPIRNLKKKYPDKKIIVVTGYPEVFFANPNVYECYRFGNTPYFKEHYVKAGVEMLTFQPYEHPDYVFNRKHLTQVWCEGWGVPFDNPIPNLLVTEAEKERAERFVEMKEQPILMMQISGGGLPPQGQPMPKMYKRNLPIKTGKALFEKLYKDYHILLVRDLRQPDIKGTETINYPLRDIFAIASVCDRFILIDSFLQHATAALGKKAVVLWGGTSPKALGYDTNINLTREVCPTPFCHRPNSYFFDMTPLGTWECPHGEVCMNHKSKDIIDTFPKEYVAKKESTVSPDAVLDILKKKKKKKEDEPKSSIDEALEVK